MTIHDYSAYRWIQVKPYHMSLSKSWEERYAELERHHIEETTFLIDKVRELAAILNQADKDRK